MYTYHPCNPQVVTIITKRVTKLVNALKHKAFSIGFSLEASEQEEANEHFTYLCTRIVSRYKPREGGWNVERFLYKETEHSVDEYLRHRKCSREMVSRKSVELDTSRLHEMDNENGYDSIFYADVLGEILSLRNTLDSLTAAFLDQLIATEGNLVKSAREVGISEKKGRSLREQIKKILSPLRKEGGF